MGILSAFLKRVVKRNITVEVSEASELFPGHRVELGEGAHLRTLGFHQHTLEQVFHRACLLGVFLDEVMYFHRILESVVKFRAGALVCVFIVWRF